MAQAAMEKMEKEIQEGRVEEKPFNLMEFLREVRTEYLKITWPSKDQVTREFFSVLLLVLAITTIIFLIDKIFGLISNFFTGRMYS